ncbi:MAG: hypothetical protein ACMUIP_11050 [bacterium]
MFNKFKKYLSIVNMLMFCILVLPGLNPLDLTFNLLLPKTACAKCQEFSVTSITSHDPNDKLIASGYGTHNHILNSDHIDYTIRFENDKKAAASAQLVTITDPLSPDLDWSTFELGDMEFSNHCIEVPAGLTYYTTMVDLRSEGNELLVEIVGHFNPSTGTATWTFSAIDPATGEFTENPLAGFLPPNGDNHEGEGLVKFRIAPRPDLTTGTIIDNVASIVFDWNPPMDTPRVYNTIDAGPPSSNVVALSAIVPEQFHVSWSGQDDADGAGIASYDIYVSENGGPYKMWLNDTTATSATFAGTGGITYAFYSVAKDHVGNSEQVPSGADTSTIAAINNKPSTPSIASPAHMSPIASATPTLTVYNSNDPDGETLTYEFEIYPNADLTPTALASVNGLAEGDSTTSWTCDVILDGRWYSWRARAFDGIAYSEWMERGIFSSTVCDDCSFMVITEKAKVSWHHSELTVEGTMNFPNGVWTDNLSPVGGTLIQLAGVEVLNQRVEFEIKKNDKWEYKDKKKGKGKDTINSDIKEFKIDWKGAKFDYHGDDKFHIHTHFIAGTSTELCIHTDHISEAFEVIINGTGINETSITYDENKNITTAVEYEAQKDDSTHVHFTLPFQLTADMTITMSGALNNTINVADYYKEGSAKFKLVSSFDSMLLPHGAQSTPDLLEYTIWFGDTMKMISGSDRIGIEKVWTKKDKKNWDYK